MGGGKANQVAEEDSNVSHFSKRTKLRMFQAKFYSLTGKLTDALQINLTIECYIFSLITYLGLTIERVTKEKFNIKLFQILHT